MTSPAVDTGIVAFIEAQCDADEGSVWAPDYVAMRRAILMLHRPDAQLRPEIVCTECEKLYPCQTVRLLAAIDADQEGYDPAWKPVAT